MPSPPPTEILGRVLLTNDDGIDAPGLALLERLVAPLAREVWVVAPEREASGMSHALTLGNPLRARPAGHQRFAVSGTPTDCVLLGVLELLPERPDLVLSGINRGGNLAQDVIYSGTVAGAREGALLGIRSLALSQSFMRGGTHGFAAAEAMTVKLLHRLMAAAWPADGLISVNFPAVAADEVTGMRVTRLGRRPESAFAVERRDDWRGLPYYWLTIAAPLLDPRAQTPGSDLLALAEGAVSVTPLTLALTDDAALGALAEALDGDAAAP